MKIVVAGASGFIGRSLVAALGQVHDVTALSRRGGGEVPGVTWKTCDLFSLLELERALDGCDAAIYLVHSMLPPNRLTQGRFEDLDLILADNFARAAKLRRLKRIVYLGGLIPEGILSPHLASRCEVERALAAQGTPLIALRAGLIVGPGGSSFSIMQRLVERLPVMICPRWTATVCQPIDVTDVVRVIARAVDDEALPPGAYDVAGPDILSYRDMLAGLAQELGLQRRFLRVGTVSPRLSRLWVSTVTGGSRRLVYPLIESLRHDMVARDARLLERYGLSPMTFKQSLRSAVSAGAPPPTTGGAGEERLPAVTSVQRLAVSPQTSVARVVQEYATWVPRFMWPFVTVHRDDEGSLSFRLMRLELLRLEYSEERSTATRQLYYIAGGILLRKAPGNARGRLEFRRVPDRDEVIAAILDYRPSLPWRLYLITQAKVHALVMRAFARHLRRVNNWIG